MTTIITIEVPARADYAVQVGLTTADKVEIKKVEQHLVKPGEVYRVAIHGELSITEIREVKFPDMIIGSTHLGRLAAPVVELNQPGTGGKNIRVATEPL